MLAEGTEEDAASKQDSAQPGYCLLLQLLQDVAFVDCPTHPRDDVDGAVRRRGKQSADEFPSCVFERE